ncbi:MAG: hypothetical protein GWO38_26830, partial [Phycisphaerae bacterium]|nr:hypothetical protein [Phycisphaerae bacterium]NIX31145.1 hypothetical protein [Phycisphaerae bacterium]
VSKKELLQRELDAKRAKRYEEEAYEETPQDVSENDVMGPVEEKGQAEAPEIQEVQEESKEQPPKEEPPVDESVSKEES